MYFWIYNRSCIFEPSFLEEDNGSGSFEQAPFGTDLWRDGLDTKRTFVMGSDDHYPEEAPKHPVKVDGFWISETPVTNRQFARFVEATGHVTFAEKHLMQRIILVLFPKCCGQVLLSSLHPRK